jgi:hypothetical protein
VRNDKEKASMGCRVRMAAVVAAIMLLGLAPEGRAEELAAAGGGVAWLPPVAQAQAVNRLPTAVRADMEAVPTCRVSVERLPPIPEEPDAGMTLEKFQEAVAARLQVIDLWKPLLALCHKLALLTREVQVAAPESLRAAAVATKPAVADLFVTPDREKLGDQGFVVIALAKAAKLRELAALRRQSQQLAGERPSGGDRVPVARELLPPIGGATESMLRSALRGGEKR